MRCANCGNNYEKPFQVLMHGKEYYFDSFECAISKLAPTCAHCNTRIIGHGVETPSKIFCCSHCASAAGVEGFVDSLE